MGDHKATQTKMQDPSRHQHHLIQDPKKNAHTKLPQLINHLKWLMVKMVNG